MDKVDELIEQLSHLSKITTHVGPSPTTTIARPLTYEESVNAMWLAKKSSDALAELKKKASWFDWIEKHGEPRAKVGQSLGDAINAAIKRGQK